MEEKQTERELFEDWYQGDGPNISHAFEKDSNGFYKFLAVQNAWANWQTSRAPLLSTIAQQGEALEAIKASAKFMRDNAENIGDEDFEKYSQKIMDSVDALISQKGEASL